MAAGRKQPQPQGVARRMWRVLRAVLYMLRRGVPSGRKMAMDLSLLLHRSKIAGKALGDLLTSHHHHRDAYPVDGGAVFSCRALDPALAVHEPSRREVEFSCSNTPNSAAGGGGLGLLGGKRGRRHRRQRDEGYLQYCNYDAADVARVFELLNDDGLFGEEQEQQPAAAKTPSPARLLWAFARSPAVLRVAASSGDEGGAAAQVDRKADEFIRRFYEQLRAQRSAASTPAASPYVSTRRIAAAGV